MKARQRRRRERERRLRSLNSPFDPLILPLLGLMVGGGVISFLLIWVTNPIVRGVLTAAGMLTLAIQRVSMLNICWAPSLGVLMLVGLRFRGRGTATACAAVFLVAGAINVGHQGFTAWTLYGIVQLLFGLWALRYTRVLSRRAATEAQVQAVGKQAPLARYAMRVFVCSTFHDMQAERDLLIKQVFPKLRALCEQRGVVWGEVDLRWGVTDEQAAEGQVLPVCFEEIRRCRPYFIGLLGERYGWIPDHLPPELVKQERWLGKHQGCSVTELEMRHGVLNDPVLADQSFFYFRSPAYIDTLPAESRPGYREEATREEIERLGIATARQRAEGRRTKLAALKASIRASRRPVREDYATPQALAELVLQDLTAVINQLFPPWPQGSGQEREAAEHEAFAAARAAVYVGGERYHERLDAHVLGGSPPLVVVGEPGSGKSALLGSWALRYPYNPRHNPRWRRSLLRWIESDRPVEYYSWYKGSPMVMHFVGATDLGLDWKAMLLRIMEELESHRFTFFFFPPGEPDALPAAVAQGLEKASRRGRIVLIIDGLDKLEGPAGALDLEWLPATPPANLRLIVSALPGRSLDALKARGWPVLEVQPLALGEREQLIHSYLARYGKALSPERVRRIAAPEQAGSPLYLRVLLEELRPLGEHERLDERIDHYLQAHTVTELYERVLARCEEEAEGDRPGLVREAMSLLWAEPHGLTEKELLELLGAEGQPLPQVYWSRVRLGAETLLMDRSGRTCFFHDYVRHAVERRYLADPLDQFVVHLQLSAYRAGRA